MSVYYVIRKFSHKSSLAPFLAQPTPNNPLFLFSNFYTDRPTTFVIQGWRGGGQACSEHLTLLHFGQHSVALARN